MDDKPEEAKAKSWLQGTAVKQAGTPEDLDGMFADALNAGDIEALVALYEADAVLRPEPGRSVAGHAELRAALARFIAMKPTIQMNTRVLAQSHDLALMSNSWRMSGTGADGARVEMGAHAAEIARRQPDGRWLFAIDAPWGLEAQQD